MHMYGLSIHQAAAMVIGRRALRYREKVPGILVDRLDTQSKEKVQNAKNEWLKWLVINNYYKKKAGENPGYWQSNRKTVLGLGRHTE